MQRATKSNIPMNAMIVMARPMGGNFFNNNEFVPMASFTGTQDDFSFARRVSTASSRDERSRCKTLLPEGFEPTPYSVICGRGRKCTSAIGNRRLQIIAQMFIGKYSQLSRKEDKTEIVSEILRMVQDACPDERFAFIKYHDGRWWEVETLIAREKIGAVLRDCLHSKYRSSTKSKLERRRAKKQQEDQEPYSDAKECFSDAVPSQEGVKSNSSVSHDEV
ncbi:hypothetical protein IV203_009260 [Nitzschia inconspicua]|uniref:DUF6824 domain-containing protein n=1 Tax=Nitzschia inconspicua TaxID=303405 RepID=A0A9K3L1Q0_9STRA|nr:hypothetical protein IV203_009260 [Nitzschia inconspicua]